MYTSIKRLYPAALMLAAIASLPIQVVYAGDLIDEFAISIGDSISDGVPGPGAGNLEEPGSLDRYTFTVTSETEVYFDEVSGGCGILWRLVAPDETALFNNNFMCSADPGLYILDQVGTYTIEVYSNSNATGTYAITIWQVPPPDVFVIGLNQLVSLDMPGLGAGNIEQPAAVDQYILSINEPTLVYFDEVSGPCGILWRAEAPDGAVLFNNDFICSSEPGTILLDQIGDYTLSAYGNQSSIGVYSFQVWSVPTDDVFAISLDQVVSLDDPGPGAGNIEQPGAIDVYTLDISQSVLVYFDELSAPCTLFWRAEAPDGTVLFNNNFLCSGDPGEFLLDQIGQYEITVYGNQSAVGTYSFQLVTVEDVQTFSIGLEQVVSDGSPGKGAGHIEEPGSIDEYTLQISQPTLVYFDELAGGCSLVWRCEAPDGSVLFDQNVMCSTDPGLYLLEQIGDYTIRVSGSQSAVGTYSFTLWDVGEPDVFTISLDIAVAENEPGKGAGYIEKPGRSDLYELTVAADTLVCFEPISGNCSLRMSVHAPSGAAIFENAHWCSGHPGKHLLEEAGTYVITVQADGDVVGAYSFIANTGREADLDGSCYIDVSDLLLLLAAWGGCPPGEPCPADLSGDGAVDVSDLLMLLSDWG